MRFFFSNHVVEDFNLLRGDAVDHFPVTDSDWVILPVDNLNAYFGTTSFDRKWLLMFPEEIIVRKDYAGICRYRIFI